MLLGALVDCCTSHSDLLFVPGLQLMAPRIKSRQMELDTLNSRFRCVSNF